MGVRGLGMPGKLPSSLVVVLLLFAGCGGKQGPSEELAAPVSSTETVVDEAAPPRAPFAHTESFDENGNVMVGARGVGRLCGGLAEQGIHGYDVVSWTWTIPTVYNEGVEAVIENVTMWTWSGPYGQVEAFLFGSDREELGRVFFSGLSETNETLTLKAPIPTGDYAIELRSCGPDTQYRVHAEANYGEEPGSRAR